MILGHVFIAASIDGFIAPSIYFFASSFAA
jgi:hypothetical protein